MYTVLDENLQVKGRLSLNNGQGNTTFFSDTITTQMATDNANDPAGLTTVDYTNQDKQGNAKQWSHTLTISIEATDLGTSLNTTDYLMYFDSVADHYYLMKVINTSTDRNSGFIKVSAINAAIFELGKQLIQAEQTLAQVDLKTFVSKMYKNAPFSLRVADDNLTVIDYVVSANTSLQALLQDLQTKYDVDVDSWVELDETGRIVDRVLYFGHLGSDNGELIRYGGAKGFENMTATEVSDIIYTKLYVTGKTNDKDTTKGHIGTVNNGLEYITDDDANQLMYAIGASQQQPVYLEGTITNSLLSEPKALLEWAKQQIGIFNHPRFNYTVSPLHDQIVALGDTVTVQDFHIKPEILVTSKVIQKTVSFASPETNTFVLGEFSSIFTDNMNKSANVINLIKKDVTVVQAAADIAKAQSDAAYQQAVTAQEKAIHAQTSADGKTTSYTVDSVQDLPKSANEGDIGWVKLSDGTHMYSYVDGKWVEKINPSMGADIDKKVSDVVTQAKDYSNKAIADNQAKVDESIKSVDDKANQLKQDQSGLDTKAQGYANKALSDAKANTATVAQETLNSAKQNIADAKKSLSDSVASEAAARADAVAAVNSQAQSALSDAKTDLTTNLNKEVTDRANAVTALDTKAQGYADTAKNDAISASTTVLNAAKTDLTNSIASEASARNAAVAAANSQAQTYANQAKADALNAVTKEVTDRQNAVSALDTKATNAVNQAKSDINDTINALSVGGRNYILGTASPKTQTSNGNDNQDIGSWSAQFYSPIKNWGIANGDYIISFDWTLKTALSLDMQASVFFDQSPWQQQFFTVKSGQLTGHVYLKFKLAPGILTATPDITGLNFRIMSQMASGNTITYSNLFMKSGTINTTWTQAPEDVVLDYTIKDNQIKATITQYKETNDGKVSQAQTDATTALGLVATKVSQTDYDQKTGDLSTKYTEVKQTADSQATDIVDIKKTATSQASKINSISSDVDGTKQSISDINTEQGKQSSKINQITSDVNGTKQSITDIQTADGKQDTRMGTIETSVSGVKSDFSTYKTTNDGSVKTAQATAQTAVDGLKTKVSQTDYNTKTGQLQTDLNTTTTTANQAKTDIVSIKSDNTKQDARMLTIESDANGTKTTVSNLQTDLGKTNGSISTLQQRADGFEATVTKVNGLSVGGRNLLLGTISSEQSYTGDFSTVPGWANNTSLVPKTAVNVGSTYTYSINLTKLTGSFVLGYWAYDSNKNYATWVRSGIFSSSGKVSWTFTIPSGISYIAPHVVHASDDFTCTAKEEKLEKGNLPTDWTPAPEDLSGATAKAQLTADQATTELNAYKTNADGRISKAQSDITQTAKDVTTKVSQTDYDKKTGDLNTAVSKAQTTADGVVTTVGNYKTSNDERVKAAESKIEQNANAITQKVSQTDYDKKTGELNTAVNTAQSTADSAVSIVQKQGTNISSVSTRVQTAEGNISTVQNNITGLTSSLKQTADGLSQEVSDRNSGDSTILQQGKDFTTSQVSNSENNMKSLIDQKADSTTIGVIHDDITALKSNTQWQRIERFDDMNYMMTTGRHFVGSSAGTNSAVSASFYIVVDAPQADRITQTQWKDLDGSLMYRRTYNGSSWSPWTQMVMSSTLLNIFHDSWSLGTTTNDGITKQMVTGIMGQPDGTLILKGNSLILDGNTTVTGDFYAKGGNFDNINASHIKVGTLDGYQVNIANINVNNLVGDTITGFNINANRLLYIAPGGQLKSDTLFANSDSFKFIGLGGVTSHYTSPYGTDIYIENVGFTIDSTYAEMSSFGKVNTSMGNNNNATGSMQTLYSPGHTYMHSSNWTDNDPDHHALLIDTGLTIANGSIDINKSSSYSQIIATGITTSGTLNAFSGTQTPRVYAWPNLTLESIQQSVVLKAGNQNIVQVRENGYVYLLTRHSGSGGVSVQMAGDGAFFMQSSATKYKEDIQYDGGTSVGDKFLTLDPATWQDKDEYEQRKLYRETGVKPTHQIHMTDKRYYGLIAEDLVKAGLEEFVVRDEVTGEVNGLEYDKVAISLIPVVREQRDAINELRLEVERLKQK